jgi:small subunit ribosomal protein S20
LPAKIAPKKSKSAIKRARQSEVRTLRNRSARKTLKTLLKNVESAVKENNVEDSSIALKKAVRGIDKAASKGILHRNTASRKVSRLSKLVNSRLRSEAT